jgi:diguanylate cyclase (GGDEF)-like protein
VKAGSILIEIARRLMERVREADTVARVGGDEFVVMIGELDAAKPLRTRSHVLS